MDIFGPKADRAIERIFLSLAVILVYVLVVVQIGRGWLWQ